MRGSPTVCGRSVSSCSLRHDQSEVTIPSDGPTKLWELRRFVGRSPVVCPNSSNGASCETRQTSGRRSATTQRRGRSLESLLSRPAILVASRLPTSNVNRRPTRPARAQRPVRDDATERDGAAEAVHHGSVTTGSIARCAASCVRTTGRAAIAVHGALRDHRKLGWDARTFSFTNQQPRAVIQRHTFSEHSVAFQIPRLLMTANALSGLSPKSDHNAPRVRDHADAALRSGLLESRAAYGRRFNLDTRPAPFPGNAIPSGRISPQAAALLGYYPRPNVTAAGGYNFQTPIINVTRQDSVTSRLTKALNSRDQLFGNVSYQRTTTDAANVFSFVDSTRTSATDPR